MDHLVKNQIGHSVLGEGSRCVRFNFMNSGGG